MRPRRPEWTKTIRFRLTVTYSVLLFALAALLVGGIYAGLAHSLDARPITKTFTVEKQIYTGHGRPVTAGEFEAADVEDVERAVNYETLRTLRWWSLTLLAVLFAASLGIGWWLSGRALRPVRRIARTAAEITAGDLSRRIRLTGPDDELRQLADTVDGMLARLDEAFAAQRQLIDDASHELRNPLAIIQANVDAVLARDDADPADRRHSAVVVSRATSRMSRLVEDLLASARRRAPAFVESDVELAGVVREAAEEFRVLAGERELTIDRQAVPHLTVVGDHDALRRAVANLLSNAVRLAPRGSRIVVGAGSVGRDGRAGAAWHWLAVRDDGPGIAAGEQARVFDRFWRSGADRVRREKRERHTGLGLAIVRQIAESHGGTVALHSEAGVGSTFVIWLPGDRTRDFIPTPPAVDPLPRAPVPSN